MLLGLTSFKYVLSRCLIHGECDHQPICKVIQIHHKVILSDGQGLEDNTFSDVLHCTKVELGSELEHSLGSNSDIMLGDKQLARFVQAKVERHTRPS